MVEAFLCVLYNGGTDKEVVNMLAENLALLRNLRGMTQEEVAEVIGISRQSYAKWEQGETIPDIEKCDRLAKFYGVSIDALIHQDEEVGKARVAPAPVGKHLWGTVAMGTKGQIVIPKAARDTFHLSEGDRLVVLGDEEQGIALIKAEVFEERMQEACAQVRNPTNKRRCDHEMSRMWKGNAGGIPLLQQGRRVQLCERGAGCI